MTVVVQPIKNTVEINEVGAPAVEVKQTRVVVEITAPGPQGATGPQGPQGEPGNSDIGGYPVQMSGVVDNDVIIFQSQKWVNAPQSNLTDGGNF